MPDGPTADAAAGVRHASWRDVPLVFLSGVALWIIFVVVLPLRVRMGLYGWLGEGGGKALLDTLCGLTFAGAAAALARDGSRWRTLAGLVVSAAPFSVVLIVPALTLAGAGRLPLEWSTRYAVSALVPLAVIGVAAVLAACRGRRAGRAALAVALVYVLVSVLMYRLRLPPEDQLRTAALLLTTVKVTGMASVGAALGYAIARGFLRLMPKSRPTHAWRRLPIAGAILGAPVPVASYWIAPRLGLNVIDVYAIVTAVQLVPVVWVASILWLAWFGEKRGSPLADPAATTP